MREDFVVANDLVEGGDEALEPVVAHECQLAIPERSLPIERMSPVRGGADLERLVESRGLARGPEKREERVGDREEEEQAITTELNNYAQSKVKFNEDKTVLITNAKGDNLTLTRDSG